MLVFGLGWRAAAAEERYQIYMMGDSMIREVAHAIKSRTANTGQITSESFISLGSGFARPDLFDWPAKLRDVVTQSKPRYVIVFLGAADNQPMQANFRTLPFGEPDWVQEYQRRIGTIMDIMASGGVRRVAWIGMPDMREPAAQRDMRIINNVFKEEAAKRPIIQYVDTSTLLSKVPGQFSPYIIDKKTGMPVHVRSPDGKHLRQEGGDILAQRIFSLFEADAKEAQP